MSTRTDDAKLDDELDATKAEIERIKAELAQASISGVSRTTSASSSAAPEPESPKGGPSSSTTGDSDSTQDWSWVSKAKCTPATWIGDGAGCIGVYKLMHPVTKEAFAVKVVDRNVERLPKQLHSFRREVDIMNGLRHPNVVRLLELVSEPTVHLLVLEIADGGELFDSVSRGALSEDVTRKYFKQIVCAVDYCHQKEVYHRDLKLENILLSNDMVKITDFGMAKDASLGSQPKTTRVGTVAYMAPEVADAPDTYSGDLVDVWSLGVMLYVCVVCDYPFGHDGPGGMSTRTVLQRIRSGKFSFPPSKQKTLSQDLQELVRRMLTPDTSRRITLAEIQLHPWFLRGDQYVAHPDNLPATIDWEKTPAIATVESETTDGFDSDEDGFGDDSDEDFQTF